MRLIIAVSYVFANAVALTHAATDATVDAPAFTLQAKAINPTRTDQIGINPVSVYEITTTFVPTQSVPIKEITSADVTSVITAPWAVVTEANGDLAFPPTPDGTPKLQSLFDEVAAACVGQSKARRGANIKRSGQCELDYLSQPGVGGNMLEFDMPGISIPTFAAGDVAVALQSVPAAVAVAFIAYVIGNGKVSDSKAPQVPASNVVVSSTTSLVPTTTNDDNPDSLYTADNAVYQEIAQAVLARISADASIESELFGTAPTPTALPQAVCDKSSVTNVESSVIQSLGTAFCTNIDLRTETIKNLTNKDASTDTYADYGFHLQWKPSGTDCGSLDCGEVFDKFPTNCAYDRHSMWKSGTLTVDCGEASYEIAPPAPTPDKPVSTPSAPSPPLPTATVGPIQCATWQESYKKCWHDVHAGTVEDCASAMFRQIPNEPMTSSSPNHTQVYKGKPTYMMNIGWIPGCNTFPSMVADNPLGHSGDDTISYTTLVKNTYYQCTGNHGIGGYVDVGCLRYGFYPNNIPGVFDSPPHPEYFWNTYPNMCGS